MHWGKQPLATFFCLCGPSYCMPPLHFLVTRPWGSSACDFAPATPVCKISLMSELLYPALPVGTNGHQEKVFSSNQRDTSEFPASGLIFHNRDLTVYKKMHLPCVRREWEMRARCNTRVSARTTSLLARFLLPLVHRLSHSPCLSDCYAGYDT